MSPLDPLRPALPAAAWLALATLVGQAAAALPTVEEAIAVEPRQQGVDFDRPVGAELAGISINQEKLEGISALVVRGADGGILRAFADSNGDRVVDRWSFYKDGIEVYREFDGPDEDAKADQSRWLNGGGTRWGIDRDGDGHLDAWKVISAQETTAEIIRALADRDAAAFERLLPTKEDLEAAGFTGGRLEDLTARVAAARTAFARLATSQKQVGPEASWTSMLTPQPPGVMPAGTPGVARDVTAYDNVVALADQDGRGVQVVVGSLVRCGAAWRPIDSPQLVGEDGRLADMKGFFTPRLAGADAAAGSVDDERLRPLLAELRELEAEMAGANVAGRRRLAGRSVAKLQEIVAAADAGERGFWSRQLVETVSAYVQEGLLPNGLEILEQLGRSAGDDPELAAFIDFRLIQARYAASMESADADPEKLQDEWFASLAGFVENHPQAPEAAEAMLQLAFRDEFEGREEEAVARYGLIAESFPGTPQARKAAGAVRRLESVGKPLPLTGTTVDGKQVSLRSLAGRPVLIHFWSTDCEPCKVDLARIREVHEKYAPRQFGCIGVAVDLDREKLVAFLREKPLPWPQLHGEGGLDSQLAEQFGILALPTMILVDADGNVVDRNVSITELERKLAALLGGK
jgi:thiol-disulfide isomerase/thioredoxin